MRFALLSILLVLPTVAQAASADALRASIDAGRCREAAIELEEALPGEDRASLWRLLGDAHRCLGNTRPAVLAYRRYLAMSGPDPAVQGLVIGLRERLGRLLVTVDPEQGEASRVDVELADGSTEAGSRTTGNVWLIQDLEPARPSTVLVRGLGLAETRARAPGPPLGGQARLEIQPRWVGVATVALEPSLPADVQVEVAGPDGALLLRPSEPLQLNAGERLVSTVSSRGRVDAKVTLAPGESRRIDARPWVPTSVSVRGLPTGSTVRVFLEGVDPPMERQVATPPDVGTVDPTWGVWLSPTLTIDSLVGGAGTLVVSHPTLGVLASELLLESGADNAAEVDWRSLPGALAVKSGYDVWRSAEAAARSDELTPLIVGLGAGAAGTLTAIVGWAAAGAQQATLADARSQALAGAPHEAGPTGWLDAHGEALDGQRAALGAASVGMVVGAAGFTISGVFGGRAQQARRARPGWTPP